MLTGDVGEIDARGVAWSGGRAPAAEPCDRAVVGHEQARTCPVNGARCESGRVHRCRLHRRERKCRRGAGGVSGTLPGADVRGFYRALGIELPGWAKREAPVGCFADPGAHAHGDRDPSCSVNVESGAWHCWGCGAAGGAYDAALACGRQPREAIDLMIAHGLTTRRAGPPKRAGASAHPLPPAAAHRNDRSAHREPGAPTPR